MYAKTLTYYYHILKEQFIQIGEDEDEGTKTRV